MSRLPTPVGFGKQPNVDGIDVAGAMRNIIAVTQADYTVKPGDGNPIIYVETGASDRVIYLPATPADVEGVSHAWIHRRQYAGDADGGRPDLRALSARRHHHLADL